MDNLQYRNELQHQYLKEHNACQRYLTNDNAKLSNGYGEELRYSPLFSLAVKVVTAAQNSCNYGGGNIRDIFPQYGLLGGMTKDHGICDVEPIFFNVDAPTSVFLCGSQGSGKSYTLSCLLENCLLPGANTSHLVQPLGGVVFHYDTASIAEAASLCSRGIRVRVLASSTRVDRLRKAYQQLPNADKYLTVEALLFRPEDLSIERMKELMAFTDQEGAVPLYMEVIQRILRHMDDGSDFRFSSFEQKLRDQRLNPSQEQMLNLRMDILKSFLNLQGEVNGVGRNMTKHKSINPRDIFKVAPGTLIVVDLSDPFIDKATACVLFNICLGLFEARNPTPGLVVACDEAHKYLNNSSGSATFTEGLLKTIRLQRHNGVRVIIATQEPTVSEKLLDLCAISIVHRFTSPAWFASIKGHLGGASSMISPQDDAAALFKEIVELNVGESLVFSPSSYLREIDGVARKLGADHLKMKTRKREGFDSGRSRLATGGNGPAVRTELMELN